MHPLSYQPLATSCWVTSMLNGILFLNKGKHVPFMANRLLSNIHVEDGVFYYTQKQKIEFEAIISAVGACTGLEITYFTGEEVERRLVNLDFNREVAVCDIGSGDHSILVNGESNGVFQAFDPYWDNVKKSDQIEGKYESYSPYFPESKHTVNLKIHKDHFFSKRTGAGFPMGAVSMRVVTVLTRN